MQNIPTIKKMNLTLAPRLSSLVLRLAYLIFLVAFTPFAIVGLHNEGKDYAIIFFIGIAFLFIPELFIKLFLRPVSALLEENQLLVKYYHGSQKCIALNEIEGYSITEEQTTSGMKKGAILYLKNGKRINFTEVNIKDITPLINYLNAKSLRNYGMEKISPWYSSKYKYDN
jgi:hypothetical protein